jgi:hypothetical protein
MQVPDFSPAAERNKQAILDKLLQVLPDAGHMLEIASGTGQHAVWFAQALPRWTWQPTDHAPNALNAIAARLAQQGLGNLKQPRLLDVMSEHWLADDAQNNTPLFSAIFCANMLHISPWATCAALMRGASRHLQSNGMLITYGPYLEDEVSTSPGNLAFDQSLRAQNPGWGIRRREDLEQQAAAYALRLTQRHPMPANNLLLVWQHKP